MILYLFTLSSIIFVIIFLFIKMKKINKNGFYDCDFKISKPKIKNVSGKKIAYFSVYIKDFHIFFIEFPIMFRFYSNYKFKSHIKIFHNANKEEKQIIMNEEIDFYGKTKEIVYYIKDIILGRINIEIETETEYGNPIVHFEILENKSCNLKKEYKLEIKF